MKTAARHGRWVSGMREGSMNEYGNSSERSTVLIWTS